MKNWYRIEFFNDDYRVFMCERKYTSINRAWSAAKHMASGYHNVYFIKVHRIGCDFECRYDFM